MTILRESPWYNELIEEGIAQGIEQGRREDRAELLLRFLKIRFGELPPELVDNIGQLPAEQLLKLTDFAFTAHSLAAVEKLLLELATEPGNQN